jgi:hypothetical protein
MVARNKNADWGNRWGRMRGRVGLALGGDSDKTSPFYVIRC